MTEHTCDHQPTTANALLLEACQQALASLQAQEKYLSNDRMALGHSEAAQYVLRAAIGRATTNNTGSKP